MTKQDLMDEILNRAFDLFGSYPTDTEDDEWSVVHREDYTDDMRIDLQEIFSKYDLYIKLKED